MKAIILLSVILYSSVVYGRDSSVSQLSVLDTKYRYIEVSGNAISEIKCIKKLDAVVNARWNEELNKISTSDLPNLIYVPWEDKESLHARYNTFEDEWLMEGGSPVAQISQCIQHVLTDVNVGTIDQSDLNCVTELIAVHSVQEYNYQRDFDNLRNASSAEQLPFRKFITFPEVVELILQNREPNTWTNLEILLYAHTKGYVLTESDNSRRNYCASLKCDWINARALREASTQAAKLKEFTSQVRYSVNKQLAGRLVKEWNLDTILPKQRYEEWLESRQRMTSELERKVEKLRKQDINAEWLCSHATELATNFTNEQSSILSTGKKSPVYLEASDVASRARIIELALEQLNDSRHTAMKEIADKQDEGTRCLSSLLHFVENHRRYELASAFVDEVFEYPEIYCENNLENPGLIRFTSCNCIGSFCVSHHLAALFEEEYALVKASNGVHKIVRTGIISKRKVWHCHSLGNSDRN